MNCPEEASLNKLVDGELDRPEADRLRAHIDGCAICSKSLARIEKLCVEVKTAFEAEINDRDLSPIWAGVSEHISRRAGSRAGWQSWFWEALRRPGLVLASSTAVIVLAFAVIFFHLLPGRSGSTEAAVVIESIQCDNPNIVVIVDPSEEGQAPIVYVTGLENDKEQTDESENI